MPPVLTVVVCTHNPDPGRLARTLEGLRNQNLPLEHWELLLVDNASSSPIEAGRVAWHPGARVVREDTLGLTPARLRGITESKSECLVWVDDDNVLVPGFLREADRVFRDYPRIGAFGGPSRPEYETPLPEWFQTLHGPLGVGEHGDKELVTGWAAGEPRDYPPFSPHGAGLCLRKRVAERWAAAVRTDETRLLLGRRGTNLASGEDNDIVLTALTDGYEVGYFPALGLAHLIPASRLTFEYHQRLLRASNRTWVVVLSLHGISPWRPISAWTLPLRKLKVYFQLRPWRGTVPALQYQAACGRFEGLAEAGRLPTCEPRHGPLK